MKKPIVLFAIFFGLSSFLTAQTNFSLPQGEAVLVYSLPKTELRIDIEIEKTTQTPGEFFRSSNLLAARDVITTERTTFRLKSVRVTPRAVVDLSRTFTLVPDRRNPINLSVNAQGLLCGINVEYRETDVCCAKPTKQEITASASPRLLPLIEEYMRATSTVRMAEGAARQIFRIRESRIALLTGDLDQLPADGKSLKIMLTRLDEMERELTELFIGTTTTTTQTHSIFLTPSETMRNHTLFRVSPASGLVDANDMSGSPYFISVIPTSIPTQPRSRRAAPETNTGLHSVLPAATQVTIGDGQNIFFAEQFLMPQFGVTIPISEDLLRRSDVRIYIDEQTGRLLRVE